MKFSSQEDKTINESMNWEINRSMSRLEKYCEAKFHISESYLLPGVDFTDPVVGRHIDHDACCKCNVHERNKLMFQCESFCIHICQLRTLQRKSVTTHQLKGNQPQTQSEISTSEYSSVFLFLFLLVPMPFFCRLCPSICF